MVRLSHFYTGRLLKNWVNVCKLRKLNDEPRHVLYNRLRSDPNNSTTVENVAQRTVQTADTDAVQNAMNARHRADSFVGEHGPRSLHAVQQPDTQGESFMEDCRRLVYYIHLCISFLYIFGLSVHIGLYILFVAAEHISLMHLNI
jgi:hypothetical protein